MKMNAGPNKTLTVFEVKKVEVGVVILIDCQTKINLRFSIDFSWKNGLISQPKKPIQSHFLFQKML